MDSLAKMFPQHIVDAGEAKGVDVGVGVEVSTIPPITSIAMARTTPRQVKLRDGVQTLPPTRLQLEGVEEEAISLTSGINNLRETPQISKV